MMKATVEKRTLEISTRVEAVTSGKKKIIRGLIPYNALSVDMGFREVIAPTAFNKTLADGSNVYALFCHDTSKILGSTRAGSLRLMDSPEGLVPECELPDTSYANDLFAIIERGDVATMSFGFRPIKTEEIRGEDDELAVLLKEVKLEEVSFGVAWPAYPATDSVAFLRSLDVSKIDREQIDGETLAKLKSLVGVEERSTAEPAAPAPAEPPAAPPEPEAPPAQEDATAEVRARLDALRIINRL